MRFHAASGLAFPDADAFMLAETTEEGTYQASHYREAVKHVTDRSVAIDAGAHVGLWTRLMARDFGSVIAVEPSADTFECLTRNLLLANCRNVETRNVALAENAYPLGASMVLDAINAARQNTGARHVERTGGPVAMQAIDGWHLPSLGFLKLDIEGSEVFALRGAVETLKRCRPIVLFENKALWHRYYRLPKDAVDRLLTGLRYRRLARVSCDEVWGPR